MEELDPQKNCIPVDVKKIHLIAVCGTAMSALACMLKDMGYDVTGSDENVYPPMSDFLAQKGIPILTGFHKDHLANCPDLVVVGNAVTRNNPEAKEMIQQGLNYCSMPQAIQWVASSNKKIILITGTHGKTTTSSLIAWILFVAGADPSFIIGGILKNFNSNYRTGNGQFIVLEGDEYDTAFFDKGPKFLHYKPYRTIITSIEFDHADIYRDLEHVKSAFQKLIDGIPIDTELIAAGYPIIQELTRRKPSKCIYYGMEPFCHWTVKHIKRSACQTGFEVFKSQKFFGCFQTNLLGDHNLLNLLSAIATAESIGISSSEISKAIETFQGVKRRQEIRGIVNGITIIDDFAHHPTAVQETIKAVKPTVQLGGRLIAVFEPRSNTSMRNIFQDIYPQSFLHADMICIRTPSRLDKIPEHERISVEKIVRDLNQLNKQAVHFSDTESIIQYLKSTAQSGDVILVMSNGGFDNIHERLLTELTMLTPR